MTTERPKGRRPKSAGQLKMLAKAVERKAVKKYMQDWDPLNLYWAKYFWEHRLEYGESSIQMQYARLVRQRVKGVDFEYKAAN